VSSLVDWNPYSDRWRDDPYPMYRELRDRAPLHFSPESNTFTVSRYDDVVAVLKQTDVFSSKTRGGQMESAVSDLSVAAKLQLLLRFVSRMRATPWTMRRSRMLIQEDGAVHLRMRDLVNRGFTPRQIQRLEPRIHALVAGCLAELRAKPEFDLVGELNIPLPVTVIAEMLGVEPEKRHVFKHWSDVIIAGATGSGLGNPLASGVMDAMAELRAYLRPIVRERRRLPADDLISILVAAEVDGEGLSDYEIFLFVLLLLVAGNETTTNLLGNAVDALLAHPEQLARVVAEPRLIPGLVEEALRFDGPVQFITRRTTREFALHGQTLPADARVVVLLGSANRDERHFPEPDRFDVTRDTRGHVAFGFGAHFCLGASLARLETRGALEALVPELPLLSRVRPEREFLDSYLIRGRARLDLRVA
jgi:cytochrome P450